LLPNDPNVLAADQALERFQQRHPEVKFLFPLITYWGPEKFGTFNHISREYTFLSYERLGRALARLRDPSSIPPYSAQAVVPDHYPSIIATPMGPPDPPSTQKRFLSRNRLSHTRWAMLKSGSLPLLGGIFR